MLVSLLVWTYLLQGRKLDPTSYRLFLIFLKTRRTNQSVKSLHIIETDVVIYNLLQLTHSRGVTQIAIAMLQPLWKKQLLSREHLHRQKPKIKRQQRLQ